MITIAHIGDGHLGKRQYGLAQRDEDTKNALSHCFKDAIAANVDVIILPGDMFDTSKPTADNVEHLADLVAMAKARGIRVIGIDGNHDKAGSSFFKRSWLSVCRVETFEDLTPIKIKGVNFYGINHHLPNAFKDKLCESVDHFVQQKINIDVLVIHQSVAELCNFNGVELTAEWMAEQLSMVNTRYVAMGDIHDHDIGVYNEITFCYPGSVEMTAKNEKPGKRWVKVLINLEEGQVSTASQKIPTRKYRLYNIEKFEDIAAMVNEVKDKYLDNLIIVDVSTDILDGHKTVYRVLKDMDVLCRVNTYPGQKQDDETSSDISVPMWERAESVNTVLAAIEEFHEPDSDEYQLIKAMLDTPKEVAVIAEGWLNGN